MREVILFGGSFDPIHNGHLEIAKQALRQEQSKELWFVLAAISPFKDEATSFSVRKRMIECMIKPFKAMRVCTIEETMPVPSYSIDTVKLLQKKYPDTHFKWLIGSDQIKDLPKWKDFDVLATMVEFLVYERPGYEEEHSYSRIQGISLNLSSTAIRRGESRATHPSVLRLMMSEGLYLDQMTKARMSQKRYEHTLRVCRLALELAAIHRVDEKKVRLAAMTHDWCKEWSPASLYQIMMANAPDLISLAPAFYHGFAAAAILSKHYAVGDKHVLGAIRGHVNGASTSKVGMILYIADKCEPGRKYDSSALVQCARANLTKGFQAVKLSNHKYVKENV